MIGNDVGLRRLRPYTIVSPDFSYKRLIFPHDNLISYTEYHLVRPTYVKIGETLLNPAGRLVGHSLYIGTRRMRRNDAR